MHQFKTGGALLDPLDSAPSCHHHRSPIYPPSNAIIAARGPLCTLQVATPTKLPHSSMPPSRPPTIAIHIPTAPLSTHPSPPSRVTSTRPIRNTWGRSFHPPEPFFYSPSPSSSSSACTSCTLYQPLDIRFLGSSIHSLPTNCQTTPGPAPSTQTLAYTLRIPNLGPWRPSIHLHSINHCHLTSIVYRQPYIHCAAGGSTVH